jgi:hypothetical protein
MKARNMEGRKDGREDGRTGRKEGKREGREEGRKGMKGESERRKEGGRYKGGI